MSIVVAGDLGDFLERVDATLSDPERRDAFDAWVDRIGSLTGFDGARIRRLRWDLIKITVYTHHLSDTEAIALVDSWLRVPVVRESGSGPALT